MRKGRTLELEPFYLNVDTQNNSRKAPKSMLAQKETEPDVLQRQWAKGAKG